MKKQDVKIQGHGFFRKTKAFGLGSGIVLGATLLFGANIASADEVNPSQPVATEVVTNAKPVEAKPTEVGSSEKPTGVKPVSTEAQSKPVELTSSERVEGTKLVATEAQSKPVELTSSENVEVAKPAQSVSDDPTDFKNREVVNKIENTQTPSNDPDSEGTYNSQIKSVEFLTPDDPNNTGNYRYRMVLHDGYTIPVNGEITFYGSNDVDVAANSLYIDGKEVGTIFEKKVTTKNHQEIWNKFTNATTLKEAKSILDNASNAELTGYAKYTIKFNEEFAKFDKNRVIYFELRPSSSSTIPKSPDKWKDVFIKKDAPAQLLLDKNNPNVNKDSYDARNETTLLTFNGVPGKALVGAKHHLNTYIQKEQYLNLGELKTYDLGFNLDSGSSQSFVQPTSVIASLTPSLFPLMTSSSTGSTTVPSNRAGNFLEKGDIVKNVLDADKSVIKFKYKNLKKGDIIELPYSIYTVEANKDLGKLYPDSESYHLYKKAEDKHEDKKVRVEILEDDENVFSFKVLEPIHVDVNQYVKFDMRYLNYGSSSWKPEKWVVNEVLRDDWLDKLNNSQTKLVDMFKQGVSTRSYNTDKTMETSIIRGDKTLKSASHTTTVYLNRNVVVGDSTVGTLKVKYVDETGKEILGHPMETLAENQPWDNKVTITPKEIDGYEFVKSSSSLQTLVGSGEQVITLTYKKVEPVDPNAGKPIVNTFIIEYKSNPKLNPGDQRIIESGEPRKTQGDKVINPGKPKIIEIGTKPKMEEEEIPFEKKTRENPNLPEGISKVVQEGKKGKKTTITTYTLDPKTGKITPNQPTIRPILPVDEITEIGKGKDKDGDLVLTYIPDPESPVGTDTVVEEGRKPKYDVTGKEKDPGKPKVIKVGTKPKVVEKEIPFKETVVENPSKPEGSRTVLKEGKVGKNTTKTTYTLDSKTGKVTSNTTTSTTPPEDRLIEVGVGKNVNGDIVTEYVPDLELEPSQTKVVQNGTPEVKDVTGKVVTPGTPTVIHIGIKPKVAEESTPFTRDYKDNPKLPEGVENVIQKGVNGKKVTTTTYTVDTKTGKVTSTDKVVETPSVTEVIERGKGKNITGEVVTQYVPDIELDFGKTKVVQNGIPEVKDVTGKVVKEGTPKVIHVGIKPKVEEEELDFKVVKRDNPNLPKGQEKVVREGEKGKKTTTTTYEVDSKTGKATPKITVDTKYPQDKIIEVGTKEEAKVVTPAPEVPKTPQAPAPQVVKAELPNTGEKASSTLLVAGLVMAAMSAGFVAKGRKKED